MKKEIIDLLASEDLKRKIRETNHVFRDNELLQIIERYAEPMELRVDMMRRFSEIASPEVSALAREFIRRENELHQRLIANTPGEIYELKIKETPDAHEERYLCDSYDTALKFIDKFYNEYSDVGTNETEKTGYEIVKRRIINKSDKFYEDEIASCELGCSRKIKRIFTWGEDVDCKVDSFCSDCDQICHQRCDEVKYPNFAENLSLLKYRDYNGREVFGINLQHNEFNHDFIEEFYVLELDSNCIKRRNFSYDTIFESHAHVMLPEAELAKEEELSPDMREDYRAFIAFLKSCPEYMSEEERIDLAAEKILKEYRPAFEELAK